MLLLVLQRRALGNNTLMCGDSDQRNVEGPLSKQISSCPKARVTALSSNFLWFASYYSVRQGGLVFYGIAHDVLFN